MKAYMSYIWRFNSYGWFYLTILLVRKDMKEIIILPVNISSIENSRNEDVITNFEIALTSYL